MIKVVLSESSKANMNIEKTSRRMQDTHAVNVSPLQILQL